MIHTKSRTAEIMSRYRPIAPKPQPSSTTESEAGQNQLQTRLIRTRKRGRTTAFCLPASSSRKQMRSYNQNGLLGQISLVPFKCGGSLDYAVTTLAESVVAAVFPTTQRVLFHQELDFMPWLKEPVKPIVISPRPVRPIGSRIILNGGSLMIKEANLVEELSGKLVSEEVEKAVEAEKMPVIVSDSRNKVRLTNSAYKEMVCQPECIWLDCVGSSMRIGGDVVLDLDEVDLKMGGSRMNGFSCNNVKIEWESDTGKKNVVYGSCNGVKLECEGKDYQFLWKFHISNNYEILN